MNRVEGPWFDDLERGQTFPSSPYTLTEGRAAMHQAIVGDRFPMMLDARSSSQVAGRRQIAHPSFVTDVAIGQSTQATQHVKANLFYRRLVLLKQPSIGDTLHTTTEVVGLRQNSRRPDRAPTGLAALRITTTDDARQPVLDFYRCAMLPLRDDVDTGHADDLTTIGTDGPAPDLLRSVGGWDLRKWSHRGPAPDAGDVIEVVGGDVVSSAPELARLTLNVARVHHESEVAGGRRLVYGGHTIGIAAAHLARAIPDVVTVLAWDGCDHLAPVHEDDVLTSTVEIVSSEPAMPGGRLVRARVRTSVEGREVLDWRPVLLVATD
ncbi:MaoC family dehydratase [Aeromicrobium alkaliterrae]|uniref:MaoC family dehydratase n=1 Tax=Aeromicrobium alkaliterrae TaxID=302168 RepID=A0ABN2K853_9ACTN